MESSSGRRTLWAVLALGVFAGGMWLIFGTREGAAARQAIDQTAEQITGKRALEAGRELESDVRRLFGDHRRAIEEAEDESTER